MSAFDSPQSLLTALESRDVILRPDGAHLAFDAPRGVINEFLPEISRFKPALLELLGNSAPAVDSTQPLPKWRGRGVLVWRESVNNDGEAPWRLVHDFGARSGVDFVESWESEIARETENLLAELDAEARCDFDDMSRHESKTANKQ